MTSLVLYRLHLDNLIWCATRFQNNLLYVRKNRKIGKQNIKQKYNLRKTSGCKKTNILFIRSKKPIRAYKV